ncbi:MAG: hypothetical protein IAE83_02670, partial [Anaerolinea sp.]|nr:hypothetical protein [Anaerolinea sp.]
MAAASLGFQHLNLHNASDVHDCFRTLGYDVAHPYAFEADELDALEFDEADRVNLRRVYLISRHQRHAVYLFEVNDLRAARLRGLAWHALQRGSALLIFTRDYRELLFVDPRLVGTANKSNVRVNKLKLVVGDATRHDLDTLNAIHAHKRTGAEIYQAQAEAFNLTTITRKFYDDYHRHYERARKLIRKHNPGVREFVDSDQTDKLHAFTQRLLGRLMFLYFLQRKGWLG